MLTGRKLSASTADRCLARRLELEIHNVNPRGPGPLSPAIWSAQVQKQKRRQLLLCRPGGGLHFFPDLSQGWHLGRWIDIGLRPAWILPGTSQARAARWKDAFKFRVDRSPSLRGEA